MRCYQGILLTLLLFAFGGSAFAQKSSESKKWDLYGYLKDLQILTVLPDLDQSISNNFLHNRLNFRWYPGKGFSVGIEQRSRLFFGEEVKVSPNFAAQLDRDPGLLDLSFVVFETKSAVLHTITDRAWISWDNDKWDIRIGRQRINWGVNLVWNPNDIFNAADFLDFDYEERQGSDAIRIQYFPNWRSAIELVSAPDENIDESTFALMYRFNRWNYDFQFLGAWWKDYYTIGSGWAGNLGNAGLKGEATWFIPNQFNESDSHIGSISISSDYSFRKPIYIHGSILYASNGSDKPLSLAEAAASGEFNASTLSPSKYNIFFQCSWTVTPLLNISSSVIYSPGSNVLLLFPSINYSIAENWDLLLVSQILMLETDNFSNQADYFSLRIKWSY